MFEIPKGCKFYSTSKFGTAWYGEVDSLRDDYPYEKVYFHRTEKAAQRNVEKLRK